MSVALPRRLAGRARSRNRTSVEDLALDVRQVLAEAGVLVLDLEGELARVAQDEDRDLAVDGLELVQRREDEHGGFAHPGLGLADDVHAKHGLRDALVLHFGRMLEPAVDHGAQALGLQDEIAEAGRVDADVVAPRPCAGAGESARADARTPRARAHVLLDVLPVLGGLLAVVDVLLIVVN